MSNNSKKAIADRKKTNDFFGESPASQPTASTTATPTYYEYYDAVPPLFSAASDPVPLSLLAQYASVPPPETAAEGLARLESSAAQTAPPSQPSSGEDAAEASDIPIFCLKIDHCRRENMTYDFLTVKGVSLGLPEDLTKQLKRFNKEQLDFFFEDVHFITAFPLANSGIRFEAESVFGALLRPSLKNKPEVRLDSPGNGYYVPHEVFRVDEDDPGLRAIKGLVRRALRAADPGEAEAVKPKKKKASGRRPAPASAPFSVPGSLFDSISFRAGGDGSLIAEVMEEPAVVAGVAPREGGKKKRKSKKKALGGGGEVEKEEEGKGKGKA